MYAINRKHYSSIRCKKVPETLMNVSDKGMKMTQKMVKTTERIRNVGDKRMYSICYS